MIAYQGPLTYMLCMLIANAHYVMSLPNRCPCRMDR